MKPPEFKVDLVRGVMKVTTPDDELRRMIMNVVQGLLGECRHGGDSALPAYKLKVTVGEPEDIPTDALLLAETDMPGEGRCRMGQHGAAIIMAFPGQVSLRLRKGDGEARIVVHPDHKWRIGGTCMMLALEDALDWTGQVMLHAACLRVPDGSGNILIHAPSGVGKTTTTLSLFEAGYGLCSDDAVVLNMENGRAHGWGFPRDLKVHRKTAAMLPWLGPFMGSEWDEWGEQALARERLREKGRIVDRDPRPILCLLKLGRSSRPESTCSPLAPLEVAVELTADNVRVGHTGLLPVQSRRFDTIVRLSTMVPSYALTVGEDINQIAAAVERAVRSARDPA